VTEDLTNRYVREAKGGVGALVIEAAVVNPSKSPFNIRLSSDEFVPDLRDMVKAIRAANSETKIGIQIMQFLKLSRTGWRQRVEDFKPEELSQIATNPRLQLNVPLMRVSISLRYIVRTPTVWRHFYLARTSARTNTAVPDEPDEAAG